MNLGFIGTGNIVSDVITGIFKSKFSFKKIIISPRNKKKANYLKKKFKRIMIAKDNQAVIDLSDWIFLGVLPRVGENILPKLKFKKNQTVVSFMSTTNYSKLKRLIGKKANIVRAIPMPPIRLCKGPVAIFPPNKKIKNFFNNIGTTIEIKNEKLSINFWAISGMMASYYDMQRSMSEWLTKRGIKKLDAQKYITTLFLALSEDAVINSKKDLKYLVKESQTPKGLNEQGLKEMSKRGAYKSVVNTLNKIYQRLNK